MIEPPLPNLSWAKILPLPELVFLGRNHKIVEPDSLKEY